jgi:hypothetical protein
VIYRYNNEFLQRLERQACIATDHTEQTPLILVTQGDVPWKERTYAPIRNLSTDSTFGRQQPIVVLEIDAQGVTHNMLDLGWRPS